MIVDDANFIGGRLRLTAFLRVVEGDIPQSPSRFERHAPLIKQPDSTESSLIRAPHPRASIIVNALENGQDEVSADIVAQAAAVFDLPGAPNTTDLASGLQNGDESKKIDRRRTPAKSTKSTKKQVASVAKGKELFSTHQHPQEKRKRRLPVNGLALLRTTTLDGGLPELGDAHEASALAIGDIDPIDDSQMNASGDLSKQLPIRKTPLINNPISQLRSSYPVKQVARSTITTPRPFLPSSKSQQHYRSASEFVADGFEAHELRMSPPRRLRRREKTTRRQIKPTTMADGLILASGLLPAPGVQNEDSFVPSGDSTGRRRQVTNTDDAPLVADDGPDHANVSRTPVTNDQFRYRQAERSERAVNSQLASITAPVRRDTESSEDGTSSEELSFGSDPDDGESGNMCAHTDLHLPTLLKRKATLVQDTRYFEHAMHHLDSVQGNESGEDDFWSQYNAME